jgi:hypothetical protein
MIDRNFRLGFIPADTDISAKTGDDAEELGICSLGLSGIFNAVQYYAMYASEQNYQKTITDIDNIMRMCQTIIEPITAFLINGAEVSERDTPAEKAVKKSEKSDKNDVWFISKAK